MNKLAAAVLSIVCFATACGTLEVGLEATATTRHEQTTVQLTPTITPLTTPTRSNEPSPGQQGNDHSGSPSISADGQYVAFSSSANNLVASDTNACADVFVYDRTAGSLEIVSLAADGSLANETSSQPSISADGRWVSFVSLASNLVDQDDNDMQDVFLLDRQTGLIALVSRNVNGQAGNGVSGEPMLSADGRWVVFSSAAEDLVPDVDEHTGANIADTNEMTDIFVYDRLGDYVRRVSISSTGEQADRPSDLPGISTDGRLVVFWSLADNLVEGMGQGIYLHDRSDGTTRWIADGFAPTISPDGRWVGYLAVADDPLTDSTFYQAMLYDLHTEQTVPVGAYAREIHGRPSSAIIFSTDGAWSAFTSTFATPDNPSVDISGEWGQQIFVRENDTGSLTLASATPDGLPGNSYSAIPSLSADGRWIAFQSFADNLVAGDSNGWMDIFVWDRQTGEIELISIATE